VDREEAEEIVRRDLPKVIKEMLKGLPGKSPAGLTLQIYESSFEAIVANLVDGTIPLGPDRRLTAELVETTGTLAFQLKDSNGNISSLSDS
jgi:hypothetical protein